MLFFSNHVSALFHHPLIPHLLVLNAILAVTKLKRHFTLIFNVIVSLVIVEGLHFVTISCIHANIMLGGSLMMVMCVLRSRWEKLFLSYVVRFHWSNDS